MLNDRVSPQLLGLVRIVVFSLWLANVSMVHLEDIAALPSELLSGYGVLWLIPQPVWEWLWTAPFLVGLKALLVVCLGWLILGLPHYQRVAILTCILLTLFDGMEKSLGHINHSKFVMLYGAYVLAAFPSADAISLSRPQSAPAPPVMYVAPIVAISLLILVPYSMIGAFRIGRSGLGIFWGDALENWFLKRSYEANSTDFRLGIVVAQHAGLLAMAKIGFAVTGILELLSPLCLVSRRFRWLWVPGMVGFHFFSLVTMNIFFWQNALLILLVMTNCDRVFAPRRASDAAPILFYGGRRGGRIARGVRACDLFSIFRMEPLEGEVARQQLAGVGADRDGLVLLDEEGEHAEAAALDRIARRLGGLWRVSAIALPAGTLERGFRAASRLSSESEALPTGWPPSES